MGTTTATKTAALSTNAGFCDALGWNQKNLGGRLGALGLLVVCSRCHGSGRYSYNQMDGDRCFGCRGCGKQIPRLTTSLLTTVRKMVAAGALEPYLAACKSRAEARAKIGPLAKLAHEIYMGIGNAYEVEYRAKRNGLGSMDPRVCSAQTMNNALYYDRRMNDEAHEPMGHRSVSGIESAVKWGKVDAGVAVAVLEERIAQLVELRTAFLG